MFYYVLWLTKKDGAYVQVVVGRYLQESTAQSYVDGTENTMVEYSDKTYKQGDVYEG